MSKLVKIAIIILLPIITFYAGGWLINKLSHHEYVKERLQQQLSDPGDRKPLNTRYWGYNADAVGRYWGALDQKALQAEKCSLRLDLAFPLFYGSAILASLFLAWMTLSSLFGFSWLAASVGIAMLADWTENSVQLMQLRSFVDKGVAGLQPCCIRIASAATMIKLYAIWTAIALLLILLVWMVGRMVRGPGSLG